MRPFHPHSLPLVLRLALLLSLVFGAEISSGVAGEQARSTSRRATARFENGLSPAQRIEWRLLEHLGWQVVAAPQARGIEVRGGYPCRRPSLAAAREAGDLLIRLPPHAGNADIARFGRRLGAIADAVPSRAAYNLRLAPALQKATRKLTANIARGNYIFPTFLHFFTTPHWQLIPPAGTWEERDWIHIPRASPARAIEAFYREEAETECYAGIQLATFAAQYELYGPRDFDAAFKREEVALGRYPEILSTAFGQYARIDRRGPWRALFFGPRRPEEKRPAGVILAEIGPQAFCGLSGIIRGQDPRRRSNENFTIVSASPAAADALRQGGGFGLFGKLMERAWKLNREARSWWKSKAYRNAQQTKLKAILEGPLCGGLKVYIHPYGVQPLGEVARLKMGSLPSPIEMSLYFHGKENAFFQRYKQYQRARLSAGVPPRLEPPGSRASARPSPPPPPPPPPIR